MRINWQKVVIVLSVIYVICLVMQVTVTTKYLTGKAAIGEISLEIASTPPVLSNIQPDGLSYINAKNVTLSFETDSISNCSYSQTKTNYNNMIPMENGQWSLYHNQTIVNLTDKQYKFYLMCFDIGQEYSALYTAVFNVSLTNTTDDTILINETDFTIINYTRQSRKIEIENIQAIKKQSTIYIQIPNTNLTQELTLQLEPSKKREIISAEDYIIISPLTAQIQKAIYGGCDKSLITRIKEADSNYYDKEQPVLVLTNESKQYTVDLYVRNNYTRDLSIIQDSYLFCSPLTAEVIIFNQSSSDIFECKIKENNNEFLNKQQPIVYKTDTNAQFEFNLTLKNNIRETQGVISQKLIVSPDNATIINMSYTSSISQLDFAIDGLGDQQVIVYTHNKGSPTSIKFDNLEILSNNWSYDSNTKLITINVSLGSAHDMSISWYRAPAPVVEAPSVAPPSGGEIVLAKKDFTIDQKLIKIMLKQGQSLERTLKIKNTGNVILKFIIEQNLEDILSIKNKTFSLKPNQEKGIELSFTTTEKTIPDVYIGKIIFKADTLIKELPVIIEVESKRILFDMSLDIVADYRRIKPGEELLAQITLFNLQDIGKTNVKMFYFIRDEEGNIVTQSQEVISVETQASFVRTFRIPEDVPDGGYILIVQAKYDASVGTASELFEVSRIVVEVPAVIEKIPLEMIISYSIIIIILIVAILYFFTRYEHKKQKYIHEKYMQKLKKIRKKIKSESNRIKLKTAKQKLEKQLNLIEKSCKLRYISKKSCEKSKSQITRMIKDIDKKLK